MAIDPLPDTLAAKNVGQAVGEKAHVELDAALGLDSLHDGGQQS